MNYCKITADKQAHFMPSPYRLTVANPDEATKATLAALDHWLPMRYSPEPEYDPETQYVSGFWVEEDGEAVQHWEICDLPAPETTVEDRNVCTYSF